MKRRHQEEEEEQAALTQAALILDNKYRFNAIVKGDLSAIAQMVSEEKHNVGVANPYDFSPANVTRNCMSPLVLAALIDNEHVVMYLIACGAKVFYGKDQSTTDHCTTSDYILQRFALRHLTSLANLVRANCQQVLQDTTKLCDDIIKIIVDSYLCYFVQ